MSAPAFSDFVVSTVIEGALELLEQPGGWATGAQARDASGAVVTPEDAVAEAWCVCGALRRVALMALRPYDAESRQRVLLLAETAARHLSTVLIRDFGVPCPSRNATRHLTEWNDGEGRRREHVVLLYRRTLGLEAAEGERRAA